MSWRISMKSCALSRSDSGQWSNAWWMPCRVDRSEGGPCLVEKMWKQSKSEGSTKTALEENWQVDKQCFQDHRGYLKARRKLYRRLLTRKMFEWTAKERQYLLVAKDSQRVQPNIKILTINAQSFTNNEASSAGEEMWPSQVANHFNTKGRTASFMERSNRGAIKAKKGSTLGYLSTKDSRKGSVSFNELTSLSIHQRVRRLNEWIQVCIPSWYHRYVRKTG